MVNTIKIGIIKPGFDLCDLKDMKVDTSTFGGMFEIKGLYDDLISLGYDTNLIDDSGDYFPDFKNLDILFIFGSVNDDTLRAIYDFKGIKVQCITDMNLMFSSEDIGPHYILNQCELSSNYHPFEIYIIRYLWNKKQQSYDEWENRKYFCVYGGGSRNNGRDLDYKKHLMNPKIDKIYTSSKLDLPNKHDKIPMNELFKEYKHSKFGLLLKDELYKAFDFSTQRRYEYMINGMICTHDLNLTCLNDKDWVKNIMCRQYETLKYSLRNLKIYKNKLKTSIEEWIIDQK